LRGDGNALCRTNYAEWVSLTVLKEALNDP